ncbi:pilin [Patescibacteria group bacterium]|nr:pilin [Patescibacteria group bacterium]
MAKRIITFFIIYCVVITALFLALPTQAQIIDNAPKDEGGVGLGAPIGTTSEPKSFADYTNLVYQFAVVIGISLAVLMIIFSGYKYMSSAGDPQSLAEAKEILIGAIVGLILILLTRLILASIDPCLLEFPRSAPDINVPASTDKNCLK